MPSLLLSNWRAILAALGSGMAVGLLAWVLHGWDVAIRTEGHRDALVAQETFLKEQCQASQRLTQEAENAYQDKIAALNDALAKRLRDNDPGRCVCPACPPGERDGPGNDQLPGRHGSTAWQFYTYAGHAEQVRLQLEACQDFIRKTWAMKGQSDGY